jgi:long-chain acyl-CoA synthetase
LQGKINVDHHSRVFADLVSGDRTLSGDALASRVSQVASGLIALGLIRGDNIAILMRNDFAYFEVTLAAQQVGVVTISVNWHGTSGEVGFILADAGAKALFAHADLLAKVRDDIPGECQIVRVQTPPEVVNWYGIDRTQALDASQSDIIYEDWRDGASRYAGEVIPPPRRINYTSGTTGNPKGVVLEISDPVVVRQFAERAMRAFGLDSGPIRAVMTGPLYHSAPGSYGQFAVRFGELLVLQPRFSAPDLLDLIERHQISHFHAVPTMFTRLLNLPEERRKNFDHSSLKAVVHGAASCPPHVKRAMIDWFGKVILEYYAATEIGIVTCATSEEWLANPGTVGRAPSNAITVAIFDDDGNPMGPGETGEIMFKLDVKDFVKYHNRPDADADLKRDDWMTLGDIGHMNENQYLWISDRKKDMVISGGVNIFPVEIEALISSCEGVADCAVFGVPDDDLGEVLVACIEQQKGAVVSVNDISATVLRSLGRLKTPKTINVVQSLPREDTGKLARRKVKQHFLRGA